MSQKIKICILAAIFDIFCMYYVVYTQQSDTIKISISQAEQMFIGKNLQLLSAKYGIDAARAQIIQAKLWSNPNISIEQNIYNQSTKRWFDFTSSGNTDVQVQQLFLLAGKRDKNIKVAELNSMLTEYQLFDLMRNLKFTLRTEIFDLYYLKKALDFYDESIESVKKTIAATEIIFQNRSILLSELLRIKSLLFSLETERLDLVNQITSNQSDIKVLLGDTASKHSFYLPVLDESNMEKIRLDTLNYSHILDYAKENRTDYKIAEVSLKQQEANLDLQRSLAVPDISIGGRYSRQGSYIRDYFALFVSIDLPFLNQNQGNVQVAEKMIDQYKVQQETVKQGIEKDVNIAYQKALEYEKLYKNYDKNFTKEYSSLVQSMANNYMSKNISVIQYTDFMESYRTSMLQYNKLQNNRIDAIEALNFVAGRIVIGL